MQLTLQATSKRIQSIDLLRGLAMIIMALDHTRDFFHLPALTGDPLDLSTTTPFLYFTRWITHFCAPTFVFLSGMSAWLQGQRKTKKELSFFLISRGLWLILIEITLITFGITADIHFGFIVLQTIWAIGFSMLLLGLVIWLPFNVILVLGLLILFGHNSLDFIEAKQMGPFPWWWGFHHQTFVPLGDGHVLGILYPFLPWTGLMILGYCCGKIFTRIEPPKRNKILIRMGISLLIFFAVLRFSNMYGDPGHWTTQKNAVFTFLSFMNVQKYPPSLLYISATIGVALIVLGLIKKTGSAISKIIIVYGRVPFFYYILHFYLLHLIEISLFISRGHTLSEGMKGAPGLPFKFAIPGEGYSLGITYLIWISVVIALYPLCKWYDRYKTNHPEKKWLSYL
ncbi:MAG: heparan-alpha-glucosaminide N-acetyltransferase domain-containing protein [Ferruginibacter sp.]